PVAPSAARIETRAGYLAAALAQIPEPDLYLVAHSMGGLDGRYLIQHHDPDHRIRALTTLGSPHRGSSLVHWLMETNGPVQWFGRRYLVPGVHQLAPEACARFNEQVPDRDDVVYRSWAACRPVEEMPWLYREPTRVLAQREGDNDSQVSVASARWGKFCGTVRADHLELAGWSFGLPARRHGRPFDHLAFYRRLVAELLGQAPGG
ncbi:MAG TPA: alpha/beta fold hydrolase, partial [Gammaproteobacteria bacterium]|nr:alpha/beta fold hydrolase [Gammaproteobacteria bacterium]